MQPNLENMRLNTQQVEMLQLFKEPMPEEYYNEFRDLVVKLLAKRVDDEMERLEKEKGWTQETYEQWGKEHMRTPSKR